MPALKLIAAALALALQCSATKHYPGPARRSSGNATGDRVLEVVQAATPPRVNFDGYACKQTLMVHDFANSYGAPYVGLYTPPTAACSFKTTIFNLSVSSKGQQYDRLAQLFFGDTEVWRTSTAMPTETGIHWSFQKDVTIFDTILREEHKIIFDLGNVVDGSLYTGIFNVTLEALYFDDIYSKNLHPAEHIYPISNLSSGSNKSSVFSLPDDSGAVTLSLPRNIKTAVVSLMASGNGAEEFWYTNVPTEWLDTFGGDDSLYGYSPFREVQLLIDDQLAGVSWPFPILFSGGVDPGLWRPVVGIDAYELPSFEIDVTPWLSLLCDGEEHTFKIQVVGFDDSSLGKIGPVGQNWWVTGTVFVWLDDTVNRTIAGAISKNVSMPVFDYSTQLVTSDINGSVVNESLWVSLSARRALSISSSINTTNGWEVVTWTQDLSFSNILNTSNDAWDALLKMDSSGSFSEFLSSEQTSHYSYPLDLYYSYSIAETEAELSSVFATIDRGLWTSGIPTLPYLTGTSLGMADVSTRQNITSKYYWNETIVGGIEDLDSSTGETWYSASNSPGSDLGVSQYSRYLVESDDILYKDEEAWKVIEVPVPSPLS